METFAARLESFNAAHPAGKKRTSNAKTAAKTRWPHKSPSPAELARAGFFYNPTPSAPDNTTCFHCRTSLDGWEEDDNAIEQHCNLSQSCGWSIIVHIEQEVDKGSNPQEDPMDEGLLEARRSTFVGWPHEDKRAWVCKTQKKSARSKKSRVSKGSRMSMQSNVTTASEDISMIDVNAIEEVTPTQNLEGAGATKTTKGTRKGAKGKRAPPKSKRKPSVSEQAEPIAGSSYVEPEDDDFEVKIEQKPAQEMKGKKRKSDEMSVDIELSQLESKLDLSKIQLPPRKRRATRNSVSHATNAPISTLEFSLGDDSQLPEAEEQPLPSLPAPKRATKGGRKRASSTIRKASATSTASKASLRAAIPDEDEIGAALEAELDRPLTDDEVEQSPLPLQKTKTRRLTRTRPGSRKVTASTAPVRRATPASAQPAEQDSSINADLSTNDAGKEIAEETKAVEIALNAVEHAKEEIIAKTEEHVASKAKTRGKGTSKAAKATKKSAKTQKQDHGADESQVVHEEPLFDKEPPSELKTEQQPKQPTGNGTRSSGVSIANIIDDNGSQINSSVIVPIAAHEDPSNENDTDVAKPQPAKKGAKKRTAPVRKGKVKVRDACASHEVEEAMPMQSDENRQDSHDVAAEVKSLGSQEGLPTSPPAQEAIPSKAKARGAKKGKAAEQQAGGMLSPAATSSFERPEPIEASKTATPGRVLDTKAATPPASQDQAAEATTMVPSATPQASMPAVQETPKKSASPQSSDAENQPPSARPSALRPPLTMLSPTKSQTFQVALNAATPVTSPYRRNISRLQSTLPWSAIDFQKLFEASPAAEKENVFDTADKDATTNLTSPEKKLTLEEWMKWRAERGEEKLRKDCERLVGRFEGEGVRALKTLEGIVCAE
ncbi:MAG: hypothetical protein Q9218_005776 [Villophora microphyllina]